MTALDKFKRYQVSLSVEDIFPSRTDGLCAYGCGTPLTGRKKRWCSSKCRKAALEDFWIIKGDVAVIRKAVWERDRGKCAVCGKFDRDWQAGHILSVCEGGGACGLDNFQTLCLPCHQVKTARLKR